MLAKGRAVIKISFSMHGILILKACGVEVWEGGCICCSFSSRDAFSNRSTQIQECVFSVYAAKMSEFAAHHIFFSEKGLNNFLHHAPPPGYLMLNLKKNHRQMDRLYHLTADAGGKKTAQRVYYSCLSRIAERIHKTYKFQTPYFKEPKILKYNVVRAHNRIAVFK